MYILNEKCIRNNFVLCKCHVHQCRNCDVTHLCLKCIKLNIYTTYIYFILLQQNFHTFYKRE